MSCLHATLSGKEVRRFIAVPEGATWAELRLRAGSYDANRVRMHLRERPSPLQCCVGMCDMNQTYNTAAVQS